MTWLPLWNICVTNDHGYVPLVVSTSRFFSHSWLITGFVTRLTRRVPLVEVELLTLPEHLSSPPAFSGVRCTWSLVLCVCFVGRCLCFCTCSFDHNGVCSSSIYWFWLPFLVCSYSSWEKIVFACCFFTTAYCLTLTLRHGLYSSWVPISFQKDSLLGSPTYVFVTVNTRQIIPQIKFSFQISWPHFDLSLQK